MSFRAEIRLSFSILGKDSQDIQQQLRTIKPSEPRAVCAEKLAEKQKARGCPLSLGCMQGKRDLDNMVKGRM
jgi:hypothetical protein